MPDDYFDERGVSRELLIWAIASRRQLERWEPLVASNLRASFDKTPFPGALVWEAATEHHFLLIAARNLIRAVDLAKDVMSLEIAIDPTIRAELIEGRDLHEHWRENLPVFMVTPRREEPKYRSGKDFAERNPDRGPYWWFGWNNKDGPMIQPNVPAHAVHEFVDRVEKVVLAQDDTLRRFLPPRQESPWFGVEGPDRWWPKGM
jgi:hypothetical protein